MKLRGSVHKFLTLCPYPINELLVEARPGEREGRDEKDVGKRVGVAERAVKRITCSLQCASSAWLSGFQFFSILGGYGGNPRQTSLRMMKKRRRSYVFKIGSVPCCAGPCLAVPRIRDSCSGYAGFRAWLLSTGPPANTKTRVDERSTRDFAFYLGFGRAGSVVAGIRDSCSGCAGFRPWLLAGESPRQGNAA